MLTVEVKKELIIWAINKKPNISKEFLRVWGEFSTLASLNSFLTEHKISHKPIGSGNNHGKRNKKREDTE